jgi:hypothetical protein
MLNQKFRDRICKLQELLDCKVTQELVDYNSVTALKTKIHVDGFQDVAHAMEYKDGMSIEDVEDIIITSYKRCMDIILSGDANVETESKRDSGKWNDIPLNEHTDPNTLLDVIDTVSESDTNWRNAYIALAKEVNSKKGEA